MAISRAPLKNSSSIVRCRRRFHVHPCIVCRIAIYICRYARIYACASAGHILRERAGEGAAPRAGRTRQRGAWLLSSGLSWGARCERRRKEGAYARVYIRRIYTTDVHTRTQCHLTFKAMPRARRERESE